MTKIVSIRKKLLKVLLITLATVMILACSGLIIYEYITFKREMKRNVSALGRVISYNSSAALAFDNEKEAIDILSALKFEKHIVSASLFDSTGKLFAQYSRQGDPSENSRPASTGYRFTDNRLVGLEDINQNNLRIGSLLIISDLDALYNSLWLYLGMALLIFAIAFLISYVLLLRLQASITEPILSLAGVAEQVSEKRDYSVRANIDSNDETNVLTRAFNDMLSEIEKQNKQILSFSHELELKVEERTSELEKINNELLQKNELVEKVINSSVDLIAVLSKDLKYQIINKKAMEIYGGNMEEYVGRSIIDLFPQLQGSEMHNCLLKAANGEIGHMANYHSVISNRSFENYYVPLHNNAGEVTSILLIGHDMTETIAAGEKLKTLNNELLQSNRELEQFAYITSHDLQEPLRKIRTYSDLVMKNLDDSSKVIKYLDKVISASHRMASLIINILDYSRLSGSKFIAEPVNLRNVLNTVVNDLDMLIAERNARIEIGPMQDVQGNFSQLCQLFLNLINNAIKFSIEDPYIFIHAEVLGQGEIEIAVRDNGIGFEPEFADKIFAPFQRLHARNEYPGTGIGLSICQRIAANHHGDIRVESVPGKGSTFYIRLPLAQYELN